MQNPAELAAKKLAVEMGFWKSFELRYTEDFENKDPHREPTAPRTFLCSYRYIETVAGQRLSDERLVNDLGETLASTYYADGSKCAYRYRVDKNGVAGQEQVTIKRSFATEDLGITHRPEPIRFLYAALTPLYEALPRAKHLGDGRRLERDCDRFLLTSFRGKGDPASMVYWLDRETGITLRFEHYEDEKARAEGRPYYVWNAESLDEVGGRHLALKSELLHLDPKGPDPQRVLMQYKIATQEVAFDRDYPKSTFWPTITQNTKIIDMINNKIHSPQQMQTSMPAKPIRAVDTPGWSPSLSTASLLLGAAALGAGLLLRLRRN